MNSKTLFSRLIENIPESIGISILLTDRNGKVVYANSQAQETFQDSLKNISKKHSAELFSEVEKFTKYRMEACNGKKIRIFDPVIQNRRGEKIHLEYLELTPLSLPEEHEPHAVISFKKKEESFVEKFLGRDESEVDTYGIVWRGICHEVKNPLGGIKGAAQMLLKNLEETSPFTRHAKVILRETERINRFLDNLSFDEEEKAAGIVDLLQLLTEAIELVRSHTLMAEKDITIQLIADTSLPTLTGDSDALFRAFVNLMKNAVEAIERRGQIRITLKLHEDLVLRGQNETWNHIIELDFFDSGKALKEEDIPLLFLPFYTSKPGGAGMGLFFAKNTVKAQGGSIRVKTFSHGKSFKVYLPLRKEELGFEKKKNTRSR